MPNFSQKWTARFSSHRVWLSLIRVSGLVATSAGVGIIGWHIAENCAGLFSASMATALIVAGYIARRG